MSNIGHTKECDNQTIYHYGEPYEKNKFFTPILKDPEYCEYCGYSETMHHNGHCPKEYDE